MNSAFIQYKSSKHAAIRTQEYLFNQLFAYIGNKRKLLPLIFEAISQTGIKQGIFADFFSGSGVVSRLAKKSGFKVIANDWEPYSYFYNHAYIEQNNYPSFKEVDGIEKAYGYLNGLKGLHGYISEYYCPEDDLNPNVKKERMFFTHHNGMRIDAIREKINEWEKKGKINLHEKSILLASLIYSASYVSNTSGVFKGFHNGWGGQTSTALYRILSSLTLVPPVLLNNKNKNKVYKTDAQTLSLELRNSSKINIAYLDPPYNQHPYGSNYHILNTISLWDKPEINKCILVNGKKTNKSAIRTDWRTERRSPYNHKPEATAALENLIKTINSDYILLSYSTDGHINLKDILEIFAMNGKLSMVTKTYKRYRVSTQRMSEKPYNVETVLILDKNKTSSRGIVKKLWNEFLEQDKWLTCA
ncbi:MAG: DNA adenine methylase [Candidatus Melainabacteria bacterium]|nr:DNA adenine methylase [Candidatus Melainabacteria bacterium]MBI3308879.1 DNA adenine methylase [Candidatus Melainabacteria bacterium]